MPENGRPSIPYERWLSLGGSVIAPATAISTLLFYFGYVSSRSQYEYFGVDVDTVGLTTQDFIMRSPTSHRDPVHAQPTDERVSSQRDTSRKALAFPDRRCENCG